MRDRALYLFCAVVLSCVIGSTAQTQFLVPDQQYRCPPSEPGCHTFRPTSSELDLSDYHHRPFTVNYVEYNDKYGYWDHQELTDAINQLEAAADEHRQRPLVIVYVHGWQNNASEVS